MRNVRIDLPEEVWTVVKIRAAKEHVNLHVIVTEAVKFTYPKEYKEVLEITRKRKEKAS